MKNKYFKIYYKELIFLYSRFNLFYILDKSYKERIFLYLL